MVWDSRASCSKGSRCHISRTIWHQYSSAGRNILRDLFGRGTSQESLCHCCCRCPGKRIHSSNPSHPLGGCVGVVLDVVTEIGVIPLELPSMDGSLLLASPSAGWGRWGGLSSVNPISGNTSTCLGVALVFGTFLELACLNLTSTCVITASG